MIRHLSDDWSISNCAILLGWEFEKIIARQMCPVQWPVRQLKLCPPSHVGLDLGRKKYRTIEEDNRKNQPRYLPHEQNAEHECARSREDLVSCAKTVPRNCAKFSEHQCRLR